MTHEWAMMAAEHWIEKYLDAAGRPQALYFTGTFCALGKPQVAASLDQAKIFSDWHEACRACDDLHVRFGPCWRVWSRRPEPCDLGAA